MNKAIEIFHKHAEQYQRKYGNQDQYAHFLESFMSLLPTSAHILDLACGPGNVAAFLFQLNPTIQLHGIDGAKNMIEIAQNNLPQFTWEQQNIMHYLTSKKYHGILLSFLLPYLNPQEIQQLFQKVLLWLQPNGYIYLSYIHAPSKGNPQEQKSSSSKVSLLSYFYEEKDILSFLPSGLKMLESHVLKETKTEYEEGIMLLRKM